jgi:hypothetical protein
MIVTHSTNGRHLGGYRPSGTAFSNSNDGELRGFLGGEGAPLQQRGDPWLADAEGVVELHGVAGIAGAVNVLQTSGERGVEDIARLVRTNLMHRRRIDRLLQIEPHHLLIRLN